MQKLGYEEAGFGSIQFFNSGYTTFSALHIPFLCLEILNIDPYLFSLVMLTTFLVHIVVMPFVGKYIDGGKPNLKKSLITWGAIFFSIFFTLVCLGFYERINSWSVLMISISLVLCGLFRSILEVPFIASLAEDQEKIGNLVSVRQIFSGIGDASGAIIPAAIISVGFISIGLPLYGVLMSFVLLLGVWCLSQQDTDRAVSSSNLSVSARKNQGRSFLSLVKGNEFLGVLASYFFSYLVMRMLTAFFPFVVAFYMGANASLLPFLLVYLVASTASIFVWQMLTKNLNRLKVFKFLCVVTSFILLGLSLLDVGEFTILYLITLSVAFGVLVTGLNMMAMGLVADLIIFERNQNQDDAGFISSIFTVFNRASHSIGVVIISLVIGNYGFEGIVMSFDVVQIKSQHVLSIVVFGLLFSAFIFCNRINEKLFFEEG